MKFEGECETLLRQLTSAGQSWKFGRKSFRTFGEINQTGWFKKKILAFRGNQFLNVEQLVALKFVESAYYSVLLRCKLPFK